MTPELVAHIPDWVIIAGSLAIVIGLICIADWVWEKRHERDDFDDTQ